MPIVSRQDIITPFQGLVSYPSFGGLSPALHSFRFTHTGGNDREVADLRLLPGGESEDLTPAAGFPRTDLDDGELSVGFQDRTPTGDEFGYRVSHALIDLPGIKRFQFRTVGVVGHTEFTLPRTVFSTSPFLARENRMLALTGFRLFLSGGRDIEVRSIGVWFEDRSLNVELSDNNGNVTYNCMVDFLSIPTTTLNASTDVLTGSGSAFDTTAIANLDRAEAFLSGWRFGFREAIDRNLLDIGVLQDENSLTAFFGDAGGGEKFEWKVWRSQIAPQVFVLAPV